jgi:hypothetical protein
MDKGRADKDQEEKNGMERLPNLYATALSAHTLKECSQIVWY